MKMPQINKLKWPEHVIIINIIIITIIIIIIVDVVSSKRPFLFI